MLDDIPNTKDASLPPTKAWKERGVGDLKLNVNFSKKSARLLMRADGVHRLVLNSPVNEKIKIEEPGTQGERPKGKTVAFLGFVEGRGVPCQIKVCVMQCAGMCA